MVVLIILLVLILLVFFVPYGIDVSYEQGIFALRVSAGPFRFRLFPRKPLTEKQKERARRRKEKKEAKKKAAEEKKKAKEALKAAKPGPSTETIKVKKKMEITLDLILALLKMGINAIRRFFRSFSIDFFKLHYTVATGDPYETAMQYGKLCALAESVSALSGSGITLKRRDVVLGSDFMVSRPTVDIRIVITLQLFKLVHLVFALGFEYLRWTIQDRRRKKAAADSERTEDNGR